jgi:hypothetical protein
MSILRPISIFLRNFLVKQHPYFSCCASCGEIKTPLGKHLCTSLDIGFPVDAVITNQDGDDHACLVLARKAERAMPWLRHIHIVTPRSGPAKEFSAKIRTLQDPRNGAATPTEKDANTALPAAALLHTANALADYYLIISNKAQLRGNTLPHDFYTPNGIPVLPPEVPARPSNEDLLEAEDPQAAMLDLALSADRYAPDSLPAALPHNKENSSTFLPLFQGFLQRAMHALSPQVVYAGLLQDWLYVSGRGVAVPAGACALRAS